MLNFIYRRRAWVQAFPWFESVPEAGRPGEQVKNCWRACTQVLFLCEAELEICRFLEIVTGWLVPSAGQKIPVQPGWYLPPQNIPLAENRCLQAGKRPGSWKYRGKIQAVLYRLVLAPRLEKGYHKIWEANLQPLGPMFQHLLSWCQ